MHLSVCWSSLRRGNANDRTRWRLSPPPPAIVRDGFRFRTTGAPSAHRRLPKNQLTLVNVVRPASELEVLERGLPAGGDGNSMMELETFRFGASTPGAHEPASIPVALRDLSFQFGWVPAWIR